MSLSYTQPFSEEVIDGKKTRILTLDPVDIEFYDVKLTLQTKEYFEEAHQTSRLSVISLA